MNAKLGQNLPDFLATLYGAQPEKQPAAKGDFASLMKDFTAPQKLADLHKTSSLPQVSNTSKPKIDFSGKVEIKPDAKTSEAPEKKESEATIQEAERAKELGASAEARTDELTLANVAEVEALATAIINAEANDQEIEESEVTVREEEDDEVSLKEEKQDETPQAVVVETKAKSESIKFESEAVDVEGEGLSQEATAKAKDSQIVATTSSKQEAKDTNIDKEANPEQKAASIEEEHLPTKQELELQQKLEVDLEAEIKAATQTQAKHEEVPAVATKAPAKSEPSLERVETKEDAPVAASTKVAETEGENSNPDLMRDGESQAEVKSEIQVENKGSEARSIFAGEVHDAKPSINVTSSDTAPTPKQMIQTQVADHIKSIVTNHNPIKGESVTTINLNPGDLGQISVQIVTKDNNTEIRLLVQDHTTHALLQEGWDKFVAQELKTVASSDGASLSFSLSQGNADSQNPQNMWDFHSEMADHRAPPPSNKAYEIAGGAAFQAGTMLDLNAGRANMLL